MSKMAVSKRAARPAYRAGIFGALLIAACGETPSLDLGPKVADWPGPTLDGGFAPCDQAPDGTSCGLEMHCLYNACVDNACGDGFLAGAEVCDDGNQRDHDGCDRRCRPEVPPSCGDLTVDPGEECDDGPQGSSRCTQYCRFALCGDRVVTSPEECDDGNRADGDACSSTCTIPPEKCGNGQPDPGEECDDGNRSDGDGCEADCTHPRTEDDDAGLDAGPEREDAGEVDAGDGEADAGDVDAGDGGPAADAGDAGAQPQEDGAVPTSDLAGAVPACAACREGPCTSFYGVFNLVDECFSAGGNPTDAQLCIDMMNCAYTNDCAYGPDGMNTCFCGTADVASGACAQPNAADGPCRAEIYVATKTSDLPTLLTSIQLTELPSGRAFYLAQCDRDSCGSQCTP